MAIGNERKRVAPGTVVECDVLYWARLYFSYPRDVLGLATCDLQVGRLAPLPSPPYPLLYTDPAVVLQGLYECVFGSGVEDSFSVHV